ncbi:MAG: FHA domain-containing protein [Deltaproteobacteria bacterium]|nr:FHA domain-containing protein [Deltaproteobacteria bacterium]
MGRSRAADLCLDHPSVSGVHVELRVGQRVVEVRDLDSTNGVRIGGVAPPRDVERTAVGADIRVVCEGNPPTIGRRSPLPFVASAVQS